MKTDRRNFIFGMTALASCVGASRDLFGASRPKFGFDISQCEINPKFRSNPLFSGEPICGVNLGFLARRGYFNRENVKKMPAEMREAGVNWCLLNTHFCQETFASTRTFIDTVYSAGEVELQEIVKRLQGEGIHVAFKPCLTLLDSAWMGRVSFPDTGEHQHRDRVVYHRFIVNRPQLFGNPFGYGMQTGSGSAGKHYTLHFISPVPRRSILYSPLNTWAHQSLR